MSTRPKANPPARAKVFWTGRSQAVRLPKEYRLEADEVSIRKDGSRLVIEPVRQRFDPNGWPAGWRKILEGGGPDPLDLGDRSERPERSDPLGGGRTR